MCFGQVTLAERNGNRFLDWEADEVAWFRTYEVRPLRVQKPYA